MNIIKKHTIVKNSRKEKYDMPQQLDLLWTIPKIQPKIIYQRVPLKNGIQAGC